MPEIGEIKNGKELRLADSGSHIWAACLECGAERWVRLKDKDRQCPTCGQKQMGFGNRRHPHLKLVYNEAGEPRYKSPCPQCGTELLRRADAVGKLCSECVKGVHSKQMKAQVGEKHPRFKGYRRMHAGYVMVKLPDDHPFRCMASARDGYVLEHRLVVAMQLGRPLFKWEVVHHLNGIKDDNRIENLERYPKQAQHLVTQRLNALEKENTALRAEVTELKKRVTVVEAETVLEEFGAG